MTTGKHKLQSVRLRRIYQFRENHGFGAPLFSTMPFPSLFHTNEPQFLTYEIQFHKAENQFHNIENQFHITENLFHIIESQFCKNEIQCHINET